MTEAQALVELCKAGYNVEDAEAELAEIKRQGLPLEVATKMLAETKKNEGTSRIFELDKDGHMVDRLV